MKHIIVICSGIAGLIAALELSRKHSITLVTKARLEDSNTRFAQGGIAAAMFSDDSVAEHIADTLRAGAGLCDPSAVEVLCSEGPARIRDLVRLGVDFDQHNGELARGLEAAHTRARVLHAGGDSTGLTIELALARAVRAAGIPVMEHTFACDLILRHEQVAGLQVLSANGERHDLEASAVILASGGAGQLYVHTTNPAVATGDGVAMALRAGAQLADLEFYQFHPTALAASGTFLISEAVRGDGAVLLDAHAGSIGPRRLFPSHRLHITGWVAYAPTSGGAPRSPGSSRSVKSRALASTEPIAWLPIPCSRAWFSHGAVRRYCSMKMLPKEWLPHLLSMPTQDSVGSLRGCRCRNGDRLFMPNPLTVWPCKA
jgi:aspartate oxidase